MALVTVQRSPSVSSCSSPPNSDSGTGAGGSQEEDDASRSSASSRSLSECYFAGKGAALVLPPTERVRTCNRRVSSDIQQHLQSMFYLLRAHDTLKMAVKLESAHPGRTRYLVVVSSAGRQDSEESALLGIDCNARTTVGLVLRVLADTTITLDGDGGFSVSVCGQHHIFKPVSVQAMWSALQTLHRVSSKAREHNHFLAGLTHDWVSYYEQRVESERSCLNEWHAMDSLESRRPPSPDSLRTKPRERAETEQVIRSTLKEIMMSVDLDEVTSKYIRSRLEEDLDMDLGEFKSFIDQEMLTILGQMDAATEIFDHVYLGSEWNASNLEELQKNGVRHILNVTREIDNFFPGMFNYQNIRVYDDEKTDLLKHWDNTFRYISGAKKEGSKVLVHCKMGVSRSASVVIAYAMKAYDWDYKKAFDYVKQKRTCIKPNTSFVTQLETYQGMLDAMKHRERLQRSKSETNLKSPSLVAKAAPRPALLGVGEASGRDLARDGARPKSWSPDNADAAFPPPPPGASVSLERLEADSRNYRMPCGNGQAYSVSQNKALHLDTAVRKRVGELEARASRRRGLVLNLTSQFEAPKAVPVKKETWDPGESDGAVFISELRLTDDTRQQGNGVAAAVAPPPPPPRDPFSAQLDRVFDREERRQTRPGSGSSPPEPAPAPPPTRDCPSRQSSWSSYDSAVVLGFQGDAPSRQSSWGSADARRAPPSRNSSWGSYDLRPPGTAPGVVGGDEAPAKRAKQKTEEGAAAVKRVCQGDVASATAAAGVVMTAQCTSVKQHKRVLENLTNLPNAAPTGLVRSLKKEFEAKAEGGGGGGGGGGGSLPSSPVGTHPAPPPEDLSVRVLVGRYEGGKAESAPVSKKLPLTRHAAPAVYNTM